LGNLDYSVIKIVDAKSGKEKESRHTQKYFSPDISHSGKYIAAVDMKSTLQSDIILMNEGGVVQNDFQITITSFIRIQNFQAMISFFLYA
jgi:hypothetical protein